MASTAERDEILSRLQRIDNYDFEHFVADLWSRQGWDTEVSRASVDAGVDVTATKETPYPQKMLIQAKRYGPNTRVGGPDIQQYASLKHQQDGVDSVIVVTSNGFTTHARERAKELNVKTVDGDGLVDLIKRTNSRDLLDKYGTVRTQPANTREVASDSSDEEQTRRSKLFWRVTNATARLPPNVHYRIIQVSVITWVIFFAIAVAGYDTSSDNPLFTFYALVWLVSWFLHPSAIHHDGTRVTKETDWSPNLKHYIYGVVVPYLSPLAGLYYLYRRRRAYENTSVPAGTEGSETPETATEMEDPEMIPEQSE